MKKICVINQKGGVGKTTTAVSVAAGLSREGRKVLLVDLDPQGNIAHSLTAEKRMNIYHFLTGECSYVDCMTNIGKNLDLIHSNETLTKLEGRLGKVEEPAIKLARKFEDLVGYDYIIFDCAPSLGILNQAVMLFADDILVPVSTTYLSMTGLAAITEAINTMNAHYDSSIQISHIVPTLYDARTKTNRNMLQKLKDDHTTLVTNPIRVNSKLAEAPASGKSIFSYAKSSRGAKDYLMLVKTIIKAEKPAARVSTPISMRVQQMMAHLEMED